IEVIELGPIRLYRAKRIVWRAEPDHGKHRSLAIAVLLEKLDGFANDHLGRVAFKLLDLPRAAELRINIKEVRHRQPLIESEAPRTARIAGQHRHAGAAVAAQMPLAKMPRHVACRRQRLGDRFFLGPKRITETQNSGSVRRSARQ